VISAFRVLEAVAERQPVGLSELARAVELPKSTVQRCLLTLQGLGWLRPSATKPTRWNLTYRAFSVGSRARDQRQIRDVALPHLNELQLHTGETIHLTAPDGRELVLVERLDTAHPLRAFLPLGYRIAMHASASGLAYLAACPDDFVERYVAAGLEPVTPHTITEPCKLWESLKAVRERGYAVTEEGLNVGVTAVGVAVTDSDGEPVGCISVSGPVSRMLTEKFAEFGQAARRAAEAAGAEL
jgi:IclR family acetate operon transcriptional repressor